MGSITSSALANIHEAARQVGINPERIDDILENAYSARGVTWDDGSAPTSSSQLLQWLRWAFNESGFYDEQADEFFDSITALDTGIVGATVVPDLEGLTANEAREACYAAGLTPVGTPTADLGNFPIGEVDDQQSPVATTAKELGDSVTYAIQLGQAIPDWAAGGTGDNSAMTSAEFEAALTALGLVGDGTSTGTGTLGAVITAPAVGSYVEYGSTVVYDYEDAA